MGLHKYMGTFSLAHLHSPLSAEEPKGVCVCVPMCVCGGEVGKDETKTKIENNNYTTFVVDIFFV